MLLVKEGVHSANRLPTRSRDIEAGDVFSYVERKKGTPISPDYPFNDVDALILSRVAYMSFEGLVAADFDKSVAIKDIADEYLKLTSNEERGVLQEEDVKLMRQIKDCRRFNNLRLCGYRTFFSLEKQEQFAALTILLPDMTAFISFRGTDGTLNGWREDFDLGFLGIIPSDKDALKYAKKAVDSLYPSIKVRLGGHSKGGNLASYVVCQFPKQYKERLVGCWIFDAPGFRRDAFDTLRKKGLEGKIHAFAPIQSIIGMILYSIASYQPVVSRSSLVFQHDIYNWCVAGDHLVPGAFSPLCYAFKKMSKDTFETMDLNHLEACIDMLFGIIKEHSRNSDGTLDSGVSRLFSLLSILRKIPKEYRETLIGCIARVNRQIKRIQEAAKKRKSLED